MACYCLKRNSAFPAVKFFGLVSLHQFTPSRFTRRCFLLFPSLFPRVSDASMRSRGFLAAVLLLAVVVCAVATERVLVTFEHDDSAGLAAEACALLNTRGQKGFVVESDKNSSSKRTVRECLRTARGACRRAFAAKGGLIGGFAGELDADALLCLDATVEPDVEVHAIVDDEDDETEEDTIFSSPSSRRLLAQDTVGQESTSPPYYWQIDRLDQKTLPLDGIVNRAGGDGVDVFVLDTGVYAKHAEFIKLGVGVDVVDGDGYFDDCNGHGTHVAALVAGRHTGVAPHAVVHSVRVLQCDGGGRVSDVLAGLEWVRAFLAAKRGHAKDSSTETETSRATPSVVVLALGLRSGKSSSALEKAIETLFNNFGVFFVVAGGNDPNASSCDLSPARITGTFAVGASDSRDEAYIHGSEGKCLDAFAPGVNVQSAKAFGNTFEGNTVSSTQPYATRSGSSMAAGVAAGVAAHFLGENPLASPAATKNALLNAASPGTVRTRELETAPLLRVPARW